MTINSAAILRKAQEGINRSDNAKVKALLDEKAKSAAALIAKELQNEFDNHEITQELITPVNNYSRINGWPSGPNGGPYGNISSYLGLTPTKVASDLLGIKTLLNTYTTQIVKKVSGKYEISVKFPNIKKFNDVTKAPDDAYSGSWLDGIENARIQNFVHYLYRLKTIVASRTGHAVQTKNVLHKSAKSLPKIPYISDIYEKIFGKSGKAGEIMQTVIERNSGKLK